MPQKERPTPRMVLAAMAAPLVSLAGKTKAKVAPGRAINAGDEPKGAGSEPGGGFSLFGRTVDPRAVDPVSYGLGTMVLLALILVLVVNGKDASGDENTTTTTAQLGVVELTSTGSGSIEPARNTDLNFETGGKVTHVYVEEGERVKKGDRIARLDRRSAELAVEQAEANLEDAENGVATTGVSYEAGSDDAGITAAVDTGSGARTANAVYTGGSTTATISILSETGQPANYEATGATGPTGETGATGQTGATGATGPAGPSTDPGGGGSDSPGGSGSGSGSGTETPSGGTAPGGTSGGSMSGGSAGGSMSGGAASGTGSGSSSSETAVKSAELELEEAKDALKATVLRAPYSGTIVSLDGAVGDTVSGGSTSSGSSTESGGTGSSATPSSGTASSGTDTGSGSAFAVLQQLNALEMEVSVAEADINQIHVGQRATVTISSADDEQLAATVSNVGLLASSDSSGVVTYPVTVRIDQRSGLVRPGMSANVAIVIDQASGVVTVPNQALSGNTVEIVEGDRTEAQAVETGLVGDTTTEIVSGLEDGQEIAIPQAEITDSAMPSGDEGGMSGGGMPGGFPGGGGMPGGGGGMPSPPSGGFPGG